MKAIGLQTPISVYRDSEDQIHLVAGYHRLQASKLLGWEQIDCIFVTLSENDRDLWEIDENLCRKELSATEKREHVKRREALWERQKQKEAETNNGTPRPIKLRRGRPKGFATETAAATGKSKRTINRYRAEPKPTAKRHRRTRVEIERDGFIRFVDTLDILVEAASDSGLDMLTQEQRAHAVDTLENSIAKLNKLLERLKDRKAACHAAKTCRRKQSISR
jgi:hypothetical protein